MYPNQPKKKSLSSSNVPTDLWVRYNLDLSPTVNGFSAGIAAHYFAANSTAFVARAFHDSFLIPGRVEITGTTGVIYVTDGNEWARNGASTGEYLVIRDGCKCSWMEPQLASNHDGLVRTGERSTVNGIWGPLDYAITRINASDGRVSIGKTTTPFFETVFTNATVGNVGTMRPASNVLVCESNVDMSTRPTMKFGNKACGLWSRYKNNNWPTSHGFYAGIDRNEQAAYVGRGDVAGTRWAGRVQLNTGVIAGHPSEAMAAVPDYLVVPNNCECTWISYAFAVIRVGLVRTMDFRGDYAVGIKRFAGGKIAITSVRTNVQGNNQWYVNDVGVGVNDVATFLLVCETVAPTTTTTSTTAPPL
jgi:hypothetical protein